MFLYVGRQMIPCFCVKRIGPLGEDKEKKFPVKIFFGKRLIQSSGIKLHKDFIKELSLHTNLKVFN